MLSATEELKIRAKLWLKKSPDTAEHRSLLALSRGNPPQLKHALLLLARQAGFKDWQQAQLILSCEQSLTRHQDAGKFWHAKPCLSLLNHWCASYSEALHLQVSQGGVLLPYKTQYVLAQEVYLQALGMRVSDPLWAELNYNWCQGPQALRQALAYQRLLAQQTECYRAC
ncbi:MULTISPECIES: hypothetical protein [unclassified Agarivorans]|uniref:hypothetical protein n=1 Tax=unclassified Agarivorans TaxID=2636026 RepID=UPI003D7DDF2B